MKFNRYINFLSTRREEIVLILILILALILRTRTIDYLIEHFNIWDELWVKEPAKYIMLTGDLNPHFFMYPSFHIYLMSFLFFLAQTICPEIKDSSLLILGRSASVLFGCATIVVVYLIGKELFNKKVGLIAALFISLNSLHIFLSQLVKTDAAAIFWVVLSFLFAVKIMLRGQWRDYLCCGIICGIAISTKYNFLSLFLPIIAHLLYNSSGKDKFYLALKDRKIILLLFLPIVVFAIASPYFILDFKTALSYIDWIYRYDRSSTGYRISSEDWIHWRLIYQLFITYPKMNGFPLMIFSLGGIFFLVIKDRKRALLLASYPVAFFILTGLTMRVFMPHQHSTIMPFITLLGSIFIGELLANKAKIIRLLGYTSLFLVIIFSAFSISRNKGDLLTYHNAEEWIKNSIPHQSKVAYFLPPVRLDESKFIIVTPPKSPPELSKDFLIEKNPDYIMISRRYFSKFLWVNRELPADTLNDLLSGRLGYTVVKTFEGSYFLEGFYSSRAPEFRSDKITILKRMK